MLPRSVSVTETVNCVLMPCGVTRSPWTEAEVWCALIMISKLYESGDAYVALAFIVTVTVTDLVPTGQRLVSRVISYVVAGYSSWEPPLHVKEMDSTLPTGTWPPVSVSVTTTVSGVF